MLPEPSCPAPDPENCISIPAAIGSFVMQKVPVISPFSGSDMLAPFSASCVTVTVMSAPALKSPLNCSTVFIASMEFFSRSATVMAESNPESIITAAVPIPSTPKSLLLIFTPLICLCV